MSASGAGPDKAGDSASGAGGEGKTKPKIRVARCCCGELRVTCEGDPIRVSVCHCYECQRRTGSAFGAQARYSKEKVKIVGGRKTYTRTGDSKNGKIHFNFCQKCGSTVYYYFDEFKDKAMDFLKDMIVVTLGAFADKDFPKPTMSVYDARAHSWSKITEADCTHYD